MTSVTFSSSAQVAGPDYPVAIVPLRMLDFSGGLRNLPLKCKTSSERTWKVRPVDSKVQESIERMQSSADFLVGALRSISPSIAKECSHQLEALFKGLTRDLPVDLSSVVYKRVKELRVQFQKISFEILGRLTETQFNAVYQSIVEEPQDASFQYSNLLKDTLKLARLDRQILSDSFSEKTLEDFFEDLGVPLESNTYRRPVIELSKIDQRAALNLSSINRMVAKREGGVDFCKLYYVPFSENLENAPKICHLLDRGEVTDIYYSLAIQQAIEGNLPGSVLRLLESVPISNVESCNILNWSAEKGHLDVITKLLESSSFSEKQRGEGVAHAIRGSCGKVVEHLLNRGPIPKDIYNKTMNWAAKNGEEEVVSCLLSRDFGFGNFYGHALMLAAQGSFFGIVEKLLEKGQISQQARGEVVCLLADKGHMGLVQKALNKGHISNENRGRAVCLAVDKGYKDLTRFLLTTGPIPAKDHQILKEILKDEKSYEEVFGKESLI